jgi:hypothetical protein
MVNIVIQFRDFLRTQLTDPANREEGNWIFDNYPREDFGSDPIVTIVGIGENGRPYGLGNTVWLGKQMLQIDIWTRDDVGYTINNITYYDKDLLIYLADLIEAKLRRNWVLLPISLFELTDRTPISFNKDKLIWNISITYELQVIEP